MFIQHHLVSTAKFTLLADCVLQKECIRTDVWCIIQLAESFILSLSSQVSTDTKRLQQYLNKSGMQLADNERLQQYSIN